MNKAELKEKWSKYCDTNKLVDDTMALLSEYNHRNTEHGVCTLLDTYFTNKEPLIKLFMTSNHYIGDMRISMKKGFERKISLYEVKNCIDRMKGMLHFEKIMKYEDESGKNLFDYLPTGKKMFSIENLPDANEQKEKMSALTAFDYQTSATRKTKNDFEKFMDYVYYFSNHSYSTINRTDCDLPLITKGIKTSRAFNKVCTNYGIDKFGAYPTLVTENGKQVEKIVYPYNKLFAEYSDLVSGLVRNMDFVISLNPLDYLTMSFGVNWRSCHHIDNGGWRGGCLSYMLDSISIITFVVDKIEGQIHKIPKIYRQMYHYENNLFVQSRLYPQGNDGAVNLYEKFRDFMIEEFSEILGIEGDWSCMQGARNNIATYGVHYKDYSNNRNANIFYPTNNAANAKNHVMIVGHEGICVYCGAPYSSSCDLAHRYSDECTRN